jgi:antibiotic biosynthesis monooxygenase (ABM) superfamily enzyme
MLASEWEAWKSQIKAVATEILGFRVGERENGEVGDEMEWQTETP